MLREFSEAHADATEPLRSWYKVTGSSSWQSIAEVRRVYPHAAAVGLCTVFNVRGGHYRLVVQIDYESQVVYAKKVMTHAEYDIDKGKRWKKSCGC